MLNLVIVDESSRRIRVIHRRNRAIRGTDMIIILDERDLVKSGYSSQFAKIGFPSAGFNTGEFDCWINSASPDDLTSVSACILGEHLLENLSADDIRTKIDAPVIALVDQSSLEQTLKLFEAGVDDVIRKPVHVREILARIAAINRRTPEIENFHEVGRLTVYFDGRDPQVDSKLFALPRRERRILEYLASIGDRRANKSQIFNAIYGVFNEDVEENVIESHISKLRKKLRNALGYDPIDSKRYLGYRLMPLTTELKQKAFEAGLIGEPA